MYFRNRPTGDDTPGAASGLSWYDNFRFYDIRQNSGTGNWVWFARAENDMLAAEAALRLGRTSDALPLIDRTRVPNGLPSVAGLTSPKIQPEHGAFTSQNNSDWKRISRLPTVRCLH